MAKKASKGSGGGPRTAVGKARSSQNALKHGMTSESALLPSEDPGAFTAFVTEILERLRPEGPVEDALAERVACAMWRLRRLLRIEVGLLDHEAQDAWMFAKASSGATQEQKINVRLGLGVSRNSIGSDALTKLSRYESAVERSMYRALHELQRLQAMREGQEISPPLAVEVGVSGP